MLTVARPVRAAARLVRKSSTALSMRALSCVYISFNAGMAAIPDIAITKPQEESYGRSIIQPRRATGRRVQRSLHATGEPIFCADHPAQAVWLMGSPLLL